MPTPPDAPYKLAQRATEAALKSARRNGSTPTPSTYHQFNSRQRKSLLKTARALEAAQDAKRESSSVKADLDR